MIASALPVPLAVQDRAQAIGANRARGQSVRVSRDRELSIYADLADALTVTRSAAPVEAGAATRIVWGGMAN